MIFQKENISNIYEKISRPKTGLILLLFSILSYSLLALLSNYSLISSYLFSLNFSVLTSLIPSLILGYPSAVEPIILFTTAATAVLIGLNLSLLTEVLTAEGATGGLTGTFASLTVSGCAACTTGVVTLAGASIGLGFLPYNGLEINFLGIALLGYTGLYISKKDRQKMCKI